MKGLFSNIEGGSFEFLCESNFITERAKGDRIIREQIVARDTRTTNRNLRVEQF